MEKIKELLRPSSIGVVSYIFIIFAIVISSNSGLISKNLGLSADNPAVRPVYMSYVNDTKKRINSSETIGSLTNILLWASLGALIYITIFSLTNGASILQKDIAITTSYANMDDEKRWKFWRDFAARLFFRVSAIVLILLLTSIVAQIWLPYSAAVFRQLGSGLDNIGQAGLAIVMWLIILHIYIVLLRLALLRTRIFS